MWCDTIPFMHDSHVHLTREPLISNLSEIIHSFQDKGGTYILSQSTQSDDFDTNLQLTTLYPAVIQAAIGLHPTIFEDISTKNTYEQKDIFINGEREIKLFEEYVQKHNNKIKAIGECGLDYYQFSLNESYSKETKEELKEIQKISFRKHLQLALKFNLPLSIHARDVADSDECVRDVIRLVCEEGKGALCGVFHSYTGNMSYLEEILDLGFYIGFNGIITYKSGENVRDILKQTPFDRILFETDGPFLPPQSVRKNGHIKEKFAQPADIKEIIETASQVKNITYEYLEKSSDANYSLLFL